MFNMYRRDDGSKVNTGDQIVSNKGTTYIFVSLTRGRLGPKVFVEDGLIRRELFNHLFSDHYDFKEEE